MKTVFKLSIFFVAFFFVFSLHSYAQKNIKELASENGVKIVYFWKKLKDDKAKGLELCMEITNTNEFPAEAVFSFAINRNKEQKSKSDEIRKCLKPQQIMRGRKKGLSFLIDEVSMADVKSDRFELLILDLEVKQVVKCTK